MTITIRGTPARRRLRIALGVSGRIGSSSTSAPAGRPSTATKTIVAPSSDARRRASRAHGKPPPCRSRMPPCRRRPAASDPAGDARAGYLGRPRRAGEHEPSLVGGADDRARQHMRRRLLQGRGHPQDLVRGPAGAASTSARCGRPAVSVPVLSNRTTRARARVSSAPPPFTMIPRRAARQMPATIAIGAASSSGHGVATTRTATARGRDRRRRARPRRATPRASGTNRTA